MITHRRATKMAPEPPIRFYRTIAVSFIILTVALLGLIIFFTSKKATILVLAKEDRRTVNFTVNVSSERSGADALSGIVTSTVFFWSEKYFPTGNKIVQGTATGEAIIYNNTNFDQPLVATTRLQTASGVLFRLSERVMVPANGRVVAAVYADEPGPASDIGPGKFTIPGLSVEKQKFIFAESVKPMSGGQRTVGVLAENDIKAALQDYANKVQQAAFSTASSSQAWATQKVVAVVSNNARPSRRAGEEVSEFSVSGTSTVVVVFYNREELAEATAQVIDERVDEDSERALSAGGEPQLSIVSYDLERGTAQLSVAQEELVTLEANSEKLADYNFFGKRKDEIEKHILGLDHVTGVEVKFSPSWMRVAPSVPERIKVIVKSVR